MPRFFRTLICVLLICCILVNVSPIRARAVSVGLTLGELLLLLGGSAGIVFGPGIEGNAAAAESSFMNSIADASQEVKDGVAQIVSIISLFPTPDDFPDAPEDGGARDTQILLSRGLVGAIATWLATYAISGLLSKGESAADGMLYFNDFLLPGSVTSKLQEYPYALIFYDDANQVFRFSCSASPYRWELISNQLYWLYMNKPRYSTSVALGSSSWNAYTYETSSSGTWYLSKDFEVVNDRFLVWTSKDLFLPDGTLYMAGSVPSSEYTTVIEPIYITEIPTLDDGSPDPEEIEKRLPLTIDPSKVLYDTQKATLNEAVQDVMQQLADGTMTHQQYVDSITPPSDPDVPVDPDPTVPSEDVWEPPENPGQFALDLSNYFPFCIPFDLYDFVSCLRADPVAPVIEWAVPLPGGSSYSLEIDFSTFDSVAQLLRRLQLLLFCVGLAFKTRDLIKG